MYAVLVISKTLKIDVAGVKQDLEMSWADGMIGAIPVFDDKLKALSYSLKVGGKVVEIEEKGEENDPKVS